MITASDANNKVKELNIEKNKKQIETIETAIERAVSCGDYVVTLEMAVLPAIKTYLETLGYTVEYNYSMNENYTSIRWG